MQDWNEIPKWEYYKEWLEGKHDNDYDNCQFSRDKVDYCRRWMLNSNPSINLEHPENIVDIVAAHKMRIATDDNYCRLCSDWADKITVKDILSYEGMGDIVIPTVFKKRSALSVQDVEKYALPGTIVKMNHGSGWNIVIKNEVDPKYIVDKVAEWYFLNYAYVTGYERQYEEISKGVIIEPIIVDKPIDYGFWCVNGEIEGISLTKKLGKNLEEYIAMVDKDGKKNPWRIGCIPAMDDLPPKFKGYVDKIMPYVKTIASKFDFVRLDMYYVGGKVYFGETTFTPCSGVLECYDTQEGKRIR